MNKPVFQLSWALAAALPLMLVAPVQVSAAEQTPEPCKAQPNDQGQPAAPGENPSSENRLGDCNGVLHPPAVGDPEMVKPAPDVGKLRVLTPDAVPRNGGNGTSGEGNSK